MEKKYFFRCLLAVIVSCFFIKSFSQAPERYLGTKTPYPYLPGLAYTAPPPGYRAVFINHTGRHGSRFLTKAGSDVAVLQLLEAADRNHYLTPLGKQILRSAKRFLSIENHNYENITLQGAREQKGIGSRMLAQYREVFDGKGVEVFTTYKIRTQQSANAFLQSFKGYPANKQFTIMPDSLDNFLRFYDLAPAYQQFIGSPVVKKQLDSLQRDQRTASTAAKVCERMFIPSFAQTMMQEGYKIAKGKKLVKVNGSSFADQLYELYTIQFSIPEEIKKKGYAPDSLDFSIAFDQQDLEWLDFKNEAQDFLVRGAGNDTLGIQVRVAIPLLADYLNTLDAVVAKKKSVDAIFRFSHAETISPFATLLGIPVASSPSPSIFDYAQHWQSSAIIPLSANIQWILYQNGENYLVKVLLNEKEVALPITTAQYPFYNWKDVRAYYLKKMRDLEIDPAQDMRQFLLDLK